MVRKYTGSCLCGKIKFSAATSAQDMYFCHCTMCRKNYGMYGAFISALNKDLKIQNTKNIQWYKSSKDVMRGFCKTCGSPIAWKKKDDTHTFILPGLINGKVGKKIPKHIFAGTKGDYYKIHEKVLFR